MANNKKYPPGFAFSEDVIREVKRLNGTYAGGNELVSVQMVYNSNGIKIRKQCSSCEMYHKAVPGSEKRADCAKSLIRGRAKQPVQNGRGCCSDWNIADCYRKAGANLNPGKTKSIKYLMWLVEFDEQLENEYMLMVRDVSIIEWRRKKFEGLFGEDCYGNKLKDKEAV